MQNRRLVYSWRSWGPLIAISLLLALCHLCGCKGGQGPQKSGDESLFVYCGAGIRSPMEAIGARFEQRYHTKVDYVYAASGMLLSMLTFSKTGDLYLPGERYYSDQAREKGYIVKEKTIAYWALAIIVAKDNPKGIKTLEDLARAGVRVGIGEPRSVACGSAAKKVLERNGLWEKVKPNIVLYSGTSPELCNALKLRAIDVTLNWDAAGFLIRDSAKIIAIPKDENIISEMPLGVLSFSEKKDAAQKFLDFVTSSESKAIFDKYGYRTSEEQYMMPYYSNL